MPLTSRRPSPRPLRLCDEYPSFTQDSELCLPFTTYKSCPATGDPISDRIVPRFFPLYRESENFCKSKRCNHKNPHSIPHHARTLPLSPHRPSPRSLRLCGESPFASPCNNQYKLHPAPKTLPNNPRSLQKNTRPHSTSFHQKRARNSADSTKFHFLVPQSSPFARITKSPAISPISSNFLCLRSRTAAPLVHCFLVLFRARSDRQRKSLCPQPSRIYYPPSRYE